MSNELLGIGRTGLSAAKRNMSTSGHNISNANTEGFSRQRAELQTNLPIGEGNVVIGRGVDVKSVRRVHDELLEKRYRNSHSDLSFNTERSLQLEQMEDIFNEVNGDGLNKLINNFFNAFRELSNQPENDTIKSIVRDNARMVTHDFNRVSESIKNIKSNIDKKIIASTEEINALTSSISTLNKKINDIEVAHGETGDLRDQRDLAVKKLSEFFEVHTYSDEKNNFVVNAVGVGTLVAGGMDVKISSQTMKDTNDPKKDGKIEIFFESRPGHNFANKFQQGKLHALIKSQNEELAQLKDRMDQMAFQLSHATNAIHRKGYINKEFKTDEQGNILNDGSVKQITNIDFFKAPDEVFDAAEKIELSDLIKEDHVYIAAALSPNSPGDNRVALAITKLQHEKVSAQGSATLEEEYLKSVGQIGTANSKSKILEEQSKGILAQVTSLKERISGVSLDEEAAQMIQYQHQFQAAAKVISESEKMFEAVLNMKR